MPTPFMMSTQKSLQMVLTILLLVLAILAMNWQERISRQTPVAKHQQSQRKPLTRAVAYADCCLYHALEAAEGRGTYTTGGDERQVFKAGMMQLQLDSAAHLAAGNYN